MKKEDKLKLVEDYMAKISRTNKRGRKGLNVTEDILKDMLELSMEEFVKRYRCTDSAYYKMYHDFTAFVDEKEESMEVVDEVVEVKKEKVVEVVKVVEQEDFFKGIFPQVEFLYSKGLKEYRELMKSNQSKYDSRIADILHKMELEEVTQAEKVALYDMMTEARRQRRGWNNAYEFLNENNGSNAHKVLDHLNLKKTVDYYRNKIDNRVYGTRELKKELGEVIGAKKS